MREYKLNKEKQDTTPSDEVINKYKNFDNLRTQYTDVVKRPKQPLYKNRKLFFFLLLIGLVAWLIAEAIQEESKKEENPTEKVEP
ncbi:MAG: hypothetical protein H6600_08450 [Flavobacteriales bacterium]|nr:hypothetical protein [Flavobacteriales bacterium]MCB9198475.1 hypothetical protein [Flavobacteriales bacterium]